MKSSHQYGVACCFIPAHKKQMRIMLDSYEIKMSSQVFDANKSNEKNLKKISWIEKQELHLQVD